GLAVCFADCETQGRILSRQRGIAFEQTTELEHVTARRSGDRVPHILSAVGVELGWPNHRWHIPRQRAIATVYRKHPPARPSARPSVPPATPAFETTGAAQRAAGWALA